MRKLLIVTAALALGLGLTACDVFESDSPTEPDQILTAGRCPDQVDEGGVISCEDETRTIGGDIDLDAIEWVLRGPDGLTDQSATGSPGSEVTFSAVDPGDYTVEQTPFLENGKAGRTITHAVAVL